MTVGSLTAQAVADLVGGRLLGDGGIRIRGGAAPRPGRARCALASRCPARYAAELDGSRAGAVLVPEALAASARVPPPASWCPIPYSALVRVLHALYPAEHHRGRDRSDGAHRGRNPARCRRLDRALRGAGPRRPARRPLPAGPRRVIGDGVVIGDDVTIGPGWCAMPAAGIGSRVVLKAGAVIGGEGFGYLSGRQGARPDSSRGRLHPGGRRRGRLQLPASIAAASTTRSSAAGPSSTTWCRWGTTCGSASAA